MMVLAHVLSGMVCLHLGQMVAKRKDGRTRWSNLPEWTWLALGLIFAFLSHAVVDTLAIFTCHDGSPSGSLFSRIVFWGWMLGGAATITWGLWTNVRYGYGILMALIYDLSGTPTFSASQMAFWTDFRQGLWVTIPIASKHSSYTS